MSLAVAAARILTVKALDGATTAGKRVFDSEVDPRDLLGPNAEPTIVVMAERGKRNGAGRELFGSDQSVELAIELFVAKATKVSGKTPDDEIFEVEYPATDAAHENRLRRLAYEIDTTLAGALSPWGDLWRLFVVCGTSGEESHWDRGADAHQGRRFNFMRLVYRVDILSDPARGAPLEPAWERLISLMEADAELAMIGKDWRSLITTPDLPTWRLQMQAQGLTYAELSAIGLAPFLDHQLTNEAEAAGLVEAVLDPDAIVIDAVP